jgi:thiamine kinase-like enzyme
MAPSDYIQARNNPQETRVTIDGQVYLPFVSIDLSNNNTTNNSNNDDKDDDKDGDDNDDLVRTVVANMLQLPNMKKRNGNGNGNDNGHNNRQPFKVRPVHGGMTNKLFHLSGLVWNEEQPGNKDTTATTTTATATTTLQEEPSVRILPNQRIMPDSVLVRVFGAHGMIDRDVETSTYAALAHQGIALKYYGRFGNGRLEEWCDDMSHLEVTSLGDAEISQGIAQNLAQLHSQFVVPPHLKEHHDPSQPPTLWTQLQSWLDQALTCHFQKDQDTQRANGLELSNLTNECQWLRDRVVSSDATVGFCHNDLLAGNVLWSSSTKTIQFIDFEYGGINYLSYDIANHFNEFAGGTSGDATPDYSLFPSPELQRVFVTEYLTTFHGTPPSADQVDQLLHGIKGFVLANHLVWGLWGINQAATEGCDEFDYLQYGTCRIQRYYFEKKKEWGGAP